jgi:hypothetical protein
MIFRLKAKAEGAKHLGNDFQCRKSGITGVPEHVFFEQKKFFTKKDFVGSWLLAIKGGQVITELMRQTLVRFARTYAYFHMYVFECLPT